METQNAIRIPHNGNPSNKLAHDDVLHIVGHGNNLDPNKLDSKYENGKSIPVNTLAEKISNFIQNPHRLIMLECCFAMGQYMKEKWFEFPKGFIGSVFAKALSGAHPNIIIGGSANPTTSPHERYKHIGTKVNITTHSQQGLKDTNPITARVGSGDAYIVPRVLYYVNGQGEWVNLDGSKASPPTNLW